MNKTEQINKNNEGKTKFEPPKHTYFKNINQTLPNGKKLKYKAVEQRDNHVKQ